MKIFRWLLFAFLALSIGCTTFGGYLVTGEDPFILTVSSTHNFDPAIRKWILNHKESEGYWTYTDNDDTYLLVSAGKESSVRIGSPKINRNERTGEFTVTIQLHRSEKSPDSDHYYKLFLIQPAVSDSNLNINFEYPDEKSKKDTRSSEQDNSSKQKKINNNSSP